jgi:hypothetical protein
MASTMGNPQQNGLEEELDVQIIDTDPFQVSMDELGFPKQSQIAILEALTESGLYDDTNANEHINGGDDDTLNHHKPSQNLQLLAQDFTNRPEVLSSCLQSDFGLKPLIAHQTRAAILHALRQRMQQPQPQEGTTTKAAGQESSVNENENQEHGAMAWTTGKETVMAGTNNDVSSQPPQEEVKVERPLYKSVVVNKPAKQRKAQTGTTRDYGLPRDCSAMYPQLALELDSFMEFMTRPTTDSQEDPLRPATATVYLRHARLFLGWYVNEHVVSGLTESEKRKLSMFTIIPTKDKDSADCILEFLLWLRSARQISVSYEANFLRGLTKLIKYRFAKESQTDPRYGEKSFEDIPLIRELRKWHRAADKQRAVAPRSSDETQKWLSWPEYIQVVALSRDDLERLLEDFQSEEHPAVATNADEDTTYSPQQRKIAVAFQKYLVVAFFANIPDRQRTIRYEDGVWFACSLLISVACFLPVAYAFVLIVCLNRELELKRSFVKDETGSWCIKHRPDDYKTGKTYGERPPLQLSASLTPAIDDFLLRWRPCLRPIGDQFFVQPRTGNPLTHDSVYQIVGRSCYQYTGKRTNPHLLRDMIVTHVRESSNASEKELEALALFMGHSVHMQRTSYDRRTLNQKVAPAVQLMESVNAKLSLK